MEHGHLLGMGGISTVDPSFENRAERDPISPVLTVERYKELSATEDAGNLHIKLRKITEADIKDRSMTKGDFLSKLIAIFQTAWFILQCIARGHQGFALTELELVTLAFACLNTITYGFWWHKPLGVQQPMRIYFKTEERHDSAEFGQETYPEISASAIISEAVSTLKFATTSIIDFFRDPCKGGLYIAFGMFFMVPLICVFLVFLWLLLPFPLGIIFLLNILKTQPVIEELSTARRLIFDRIILVLRKFRYRFTSYIASVSEKWIRIFLDGSSLFGFCIGWVVILPSLFILYS